MPLKEITDKNGRCFTWWEYGGHFGPANARNVYFPQDPETQLKELRTFEIRDNDVLICTFPKAGTHWIWEIVSMVIKGAAIYETKTNGDLMLELTAIDKLNSAPSPRVLNSRLTISNLPQQIFSKHTKIIHIMRNPKDMVTSFYNHLLQAMKYVPEEERMFETFSDFLPYMTGEYGIYLVVSMFKYYKEMIQFTKDNPAQVLNLHFEEMKRNETEAVRKVADFLNKDLPDDMIAAIADRCSFKNLKHAAETYKQEWDLTSKLSKEEQEIIAQRKPEQTRFYRKGEIGDWKKHFTVAENEQFDELLAEQFKDCDIEFIRPIACASDMPLKEITDRKGRRFTWIEIGVHNWPLSGSNVYFPQDPEKQLKEVKSFEIRDNDVLICTFPKADFLRPTGTHWIWEIVSMVTKGAADYETKTNGDFMLEFTSLDKLNSAPSPRILNSHLAISCLPEQVFSKHTKIIHVMRNPKDMVTSFYHHLLQSMKFTPENERFFETFSEYLPYMTGEYGVYCFVSMFKYYKEMAKFRKDNPAQVLNLHFEEMKRNETEAVRKVANFLNKDLPDDVMRDIADKCSFKNLKHATETYKQPWDLTSKLSPVEQEIIAKWKKQETQFYRKGEIGDWKNHFTVAENEQFDDLLAEQFKDGDIEFLYA